MSRKGGCNEGDTLTDFNTPNRRKSRRIYNHITVDDKQDRELKYKGQTKEWVNGVNQWNTQEKENSTWTRWKLKVCLHDTTFMHYGCSFTWQEGLKMPASENNVQGFWKRPLYPLHANNRNVNLWKWCDRAHAYNMFSDISIYWPAMYNTALLWTGLFWRSCRLCIVVL